MSSQHLLNNLQSWHLPGNFNSLNSSGLKAFGFTGFQAYSDQTASSERPAWRFIFLLFYYFFLSQAEILEKAKGGNVLDHSEGEKNRLSTKRKLLCEYGEPQTLRKTYKRETKHNTLLFYQMVEG